MPSNQRLILASSSPYKKRLLERLNIDFQAQGADIDESPQEDEPPRQMARRLAEAKARTIAAQNPSAFVIGSDQVIASEGKIFQKPGTVESAVDQLRALQGKTHHLINAVCLHHPGGTLDHMTVTYNMIMRPLTQAQIEGYVALDTPLDCAGSYRIEAAGIRLFEATEGDDPTAIEGLPLTRIWTLLLAAGWSND